MKKVLRCQLVYKPYTLHLLQVLKLYNKGKRTNFSNFVLKQFKNNEGFVEKLEFSDKATSHLGGKINRHNVRSWDSENPPVIYEHKRDSPKVNVFCAISNTKVMSYFCW